MLNKENVKIKITYKFIYNYKTYLYTKENKLLIKNEINIFLP